MQTDTGGVKNQTGNYEISHLGSQSLRTLLKKDLKKIKNDIVQWNDVARILPGGRRRLAVSTAPCKSPPPLLRMSMTIAERSSLSPPLGIHRYYII